MLPEKPWKADLLVRLLVGVMICVFAGPTLLVLADYRVASSTMAPLAFYGLAAVSLACSGAALVLNLRAWSAERLTSRLVLFCVCLFVGLTLTNWLQRAIIPGPEDRPTVWRVVIATLSFQGTALVLVHWFVRQHQMGWANAFGLTRRNLGRAILLGALLALAAVPLGALLQSGCARLLTLVHVEAKEQSMVEILRLTESWPARIYFGFAAIVLAPVAEEAIFRGILYPAIKQLGYPRAALWGASLVFGVFHANLVSFLPLVLLAVALTVLYQKTHNLLAPIVAHSCFNGLGFVLLVNEQSIRHFFERFVR